MTGELERVWPQVSARLTVQLRRRGVSPADCEDLVQECAVRLLRASVTFTDADDLLRWCTTVVRNLHVDLTRRPSADPLPQGLEVADHTDVPRSVTARLLLAEVTAVWPQLSERDRSVLAESDVATDRQEQLRRGTARRRARARLQAMLSGALGGIGVTALAGRRVTLTTAPVLVLSAAFLLVPVMPAGPPALTVPALTRLPSAGTSPVAVRRSSLAPANTAPARAGLMQSEDVAPPRRSAGRPAADRQTVAQAVLARDRVTVSHGPHQDGAPIVRFCADTVPLDAHACASVGHDQWRAAP